VKDLLLRRILDLVQPVHRPVARVIAGGGQAADPGLAAHPADLDKALTKAANVVKRTVEATTDELTSELQEALKS